MSVYLSATKASLNIELSKLPILLTYKAALASFRNAVNLVHPPQMKPGNRVRRNVREANSSGGRGRTNQGGYGPRKGDCTTRGGHGGCSGHGGYVHKTRSDSRIITLTDGKKIEYHASFTFPNNVYRAMQPQDKEQLKREREEYQNFNQGNRRLKSRIEQLERQLSINDETSTSSEITMAIITPTLLLPLLKMLVPI